MEYADLLATDPRRLRSRTEPTRWSPLEYACHVRDVLLAQRERVLAARRDDNPAVLPMGRNERVEHDGYLDQQPADVARQLRDAVLLFGNVLDRLTEPEWERTMRYNYPDPEHPDRRCMRWVAVHSLHELRHHLLDMRQQLDS